jgi:hypothetical protein
VNTKLRGVNANREAARAGRNVITTQRPLTPFIDLSAGIERKRVRWDGYATG